jgi:L-amino acid N-acyltransferase YncA
MITYQVEKWNDVVDEMKPLWPLHWEEVAVDKDEIKLNPDYASYENYDRNGALHIVVMRESGRVCGYHVSIVRPHLHYMESLSAFVDVYYIEKQYRGQKAGLKLFQEAERTLKARGVQKIFSGTKKHLDFSKLFEGLGYTATETQFTKLI